MNRVRIVIYIFIIKTAKSLSIDYEIFFFLRFYLSIHERHTERSWDIGRGRSKLPVGSLMKDWIPGPWDQDLSQRQMLNQWAIQASQIMQLLR